MPLLTQRGAFLQVPDEVLHVLGDVLGVLEGSVHPPLAALQHHVHLLGGRTTCGYKGKVGRERGD